MNLDIERYCCKQPRSLFILGSRLREVRNISSRWAICEQNYSKESTARVFPLKMGDFGIDWYISVAHEVLNA